MLFILLAGALARPETIEFKIVPKAILEKRLRLAHPSAAVRYERLKGLFEETGCANLREQKVRSSKEPNLICAVEGAGESPNRILVGAHFDCRGGDGVVDNWTGAILLPSLAQFMREKARRHSFEFIGFAAEEKGLLGSAAYLKAIPKPERQRIAAVVTMDSLGLTPPKFWPNSSNDQLVLLAARMAHSLNLSFAGVNVDRVGTTDSMTFHRAKLPVLSLHSVTQETLGLINSEKDVWPAISWDDYYETHRFVSALLSYLDTTLP